MAEMGFTQEEIRDSLENGKFNNVTATYLLLGTSAATATTTPTRATDRQPPKLHSNLAVSSKSHASAAVAGAQASTPEVKAAAATPAASSASTTTTATATRHSSTLSPAPEHASGAVVPSAESNNFEPPG